MSRWFFCLVIVNALIFFVPTAALAEELILQDDFERVESDPGVEEIGNDWATNSKSRAKGIKQVDLRDGAMHIHRADVADHGVSVTHEVAFKDATISLRFKLGAKDTLGINIADLKEKSVHAGHLCVAVIGLSKVEISDLKTGRMALEMRNRRRAKTATQEDKELLKTKSKYFKHNLDADCWYQLQVKISGETMSVSIDGKPVGSFTSAGIGHASKSRLRLAVAKSAWVDDVRVTRQ